MISNIFINVLLILNLFFQGNSLILQDNSKTNNSIKISPDGINYRPSISPDHKYISFLHDAANAEDANIWMYDIAQNKSMKISSMDLSYGYDDSPAWSNDSKSLYFSSKGKIYKINIGSMNVELVCQPDSDSISFLAPGLSGDGRKLAFRVFFSTDEADSMSIWVMDLTTKDIKKFPQSEYRFRNEVIFTKPLWYDDDSYIAAVLFPSYTMPGIYILNQKDLNQKRIIGDISDPHFKIINDVLYCAKLFNTGSSVYQTTLYQYNLKSSKLNKMFAINDNQFDVAKINDSVKILFDKERNLQVYSNNKIKQLNIKGIDPLYYDMYFIFSVTKVNYSETTESILYLIKNLNL